MADEAPLRSPWKRLLDRATVIYAADVELEAVRWLWSGRMPLGKITTLDGDPGLAKSTLLFDLSARISDGRPLPNGDPLDGPKDVIILSAEDGLADTIVGPIPPSLAYRSVTDEAHGCGRIEWERETGHIADTLPRRQRARRIGEL